MILAKFTEKYKQKLAVSVSSAWSSVLTGSHIHRCKQIWRWNCLQSRCTDNNVPSMNNAVLSLIWLLFYSHRIWRKINKFLQESILTDMSFSSQGWMFPQCNEQVDHLILEMGKAEEIQDICCWWWRWTMPWLWLCDYKGECWQKPLILHS